ncbi:hypothetical protein J6590_068343 [Homalodisca vitripennis]|nr:hypothetical protein J6590_068343 [Homalodisca vitripennis]
MENTNREQETRPCPYSFAIVLGIQERKNKLRTAAAVTKKPSSSKPFSRACADVGCSCLCHSWDGKEVTGAGLDKTCKVEQPMQIRRLQSTNEIPPEKLSHGNALDTV